MIGMGEIAEEFGDGILAPPDSDYRLDASDDDYEDKSDDYYSYDTYWLQDMSKKQMINCFFILFIFVKVKKKKNLKIQMDEINDNCDRGIYIYIFCIS